MTIDSCTRCGVKLRCVYVNSSPPILCGDCADGGLTPGEEQAVLAKLAVKFARNNEGRVGGQG